MHMSQQAGKAAEPSNYMLPKKGTQTEPGERQALECDVASDGEMGLG